MTFLPLASTLLLDGSGLVTTRQSHSPTNNTSMSPEIAAESRVTVTLVGAIVPFVFASIFVVARLISRGFIVKSWGQDDWWISLSWATAFVMAATDCGLTAYGSGRHEGLQTQAQLRATLIGTYVAHIMYQAALGTTKIGVCTFYLRVFQDPPNRYFTLTIMSFIAVFSAGLVLDGIFECIPGTASEGSCFQNSPTFYISAVCNIWADIVLVTFMFFKIMPLNMPVKQKRALLIVVSLGVLMIVAAIVRTVRVVGVADSSDISWDGWDISTWSSVEVNVGLFCASAPATKPLFRKLAPKALVSLGSHSRPTHIPHETRRNDTTKWPRSRSYVDIELSSRQEDIEMVTPNHMRTGTFWPSSRNSNSLERDGDGESARRVLGDPTISSMTSRSTSENNMEQRDSSWSERADHIGHA